MPRINFAMHSYEGQVIWRFFDSVSSSVSKRMLRGSLPGEPNLTFLLCELLDEGATELHTLPYSLSQAKEDLAKADSGITIDVEFETHEHSQWYEGKHSGADLGIILSIAHPILGNARRGILLQAKKLFGKPQQFTLFSAYSGYKAPQAEILSELADRFGARNSTFYLLYNPPGAGFKENDAKLIRAYEAQSRAASPYWGRWHPFFDELLEMGFPWNFGFGEKDHDNSREEEEAKSNWRSTQPAIRVSALEAVLEMAKMTNPPMLKQFYDSLMEPGRFDRVSYAPFADFAVLALASPRIGNAGEEWLKVVEGAAVPVPPSKQPQDDRRPSVLDSLPHAPIPRHTLKVSVTSTLPQIG